MLDVEYIIVFNVADGTAKPGIKNIGERFDIVLAGLIKVGDV